MQKQLLTRSNWHGQIMKRCNAVQLCTPVDRARDGSVATCFRPRALKLARLPCCHMTSCDVMTSAWDRLCSTGALVQLRGSYRKVGATDATKEACLHLLVTGVPPCSLVAYPYIMSSSI